MKNTLLIIGILLFVAFSNLISKPTDIVWAKYGVDENTDNFEFSPDGNYLAVFKRDGLIFKVFPVNREGEPLVFINPLITKIYSVTWSQDLSSVAVVYSTFDKLEVSEWNLKDFTLKNSFNTSVYSPVTAELSPDMNLLLYKGQMGFGYTLNKESMIGHVLLEEYNDSLQSVSVSRNAELAAVLTTNGIFVIESDSLTRIVKQRYYNGAFENCRIEFSPNTDYLTVYHRESKKAEIYSLNDLSLFRTHDNTNMPVFISKTSYIVNDGTRLALYELSSNTPVSHSKEDFSRNFGAALLSGGKIGIAYADYSSCLMIDFDTNDTLKTFSINNFYAKFTDRGYAIFTPHFDNIYATEEGKLLATHKKLTSVLPDTNIAYLFIEPNTISLFDIYTKNKIKDYTFIGQFLDAYMLNHNYAVMTTSDLKRQLFDLRTNQMLLEYDSYSTDMKISRKGTYLAVPSSDTENGTLFLLIIDMKTKNTLFNISFDELNTYHFAFSPDEKSFYYSSKPGIISIIDLENRKQKSDIDVNSANAPMPYYITVTEDSKYLAIYNPLNNIQIFNIAEKSVAYYYEDYFEYLTSFGVSSDGDFVLASYEDGTCILFKARFGTAPVNDLPQNETKISIFPNPAHNFSELRLALETDVTLTYSISNVLGIPITSGKANEIGNGLFSLNLPDNLPSIPGIYFIRLKSSAFETIVPVIIKK